MAWRKRSIHASLQRFRPLSRTPCSGKARTRVGRLLGDALANVLMHVADGRARLEKNPAPDSDAWVDAFLLATARTGDSDLMTETWADLGRPAPPFSNPVTSSMVQRLKRDPSMPLEAFEKPIFDCGLMDAQPPVGRSVSTAPCHPTC